MATSGQVGSDMGIACGPIRSGALVPAPGKKELAGEKKGFWNGRNLVIGVAGQHATTSFQTLQRGSCARVVV